MGIALYQKIYKVMFPHVYLGAIRKRGIND